MKWQGFVLIFAGACLYALYDVLNKKLLLKKAPDECIGTVNFLGSGILLLVISILLDPPSISNWFNFYHGLFWPLLATSLLNIVIGFGNVKALKYGDVSLIAPISATQPMVVLIPSWLILREAPTFWGYVGLFVMAIGMYIFSFAEEIKGWKAPSWLMWMGKRARYLAPWLVLFKNRGVQIAMLVALCGAVAINFDKLSATRSSATFAPACILIFCGIVGLVRTVYMKQWVGITREHAIHVSTSPIVLAVVIICYWVAFKYGMAAYVGALKRSTVLFALILSFIFLGERREIKKRWPGALIMTFGAALLAI